MARIRDTSKDALRATKPQRLASLDALRGVCLLAIASAGFGLHQLAGDAHWGWLGAQVQPRSWFGATVADLIPPVFLVIAGAALPFAYAARQGGGWSRQLLHAVLRTVVLVALGMYIDSYYAGRLTFNVRGELQLLGLANFVAFLIMPLGIHVQALAALFLLGLHTTAYVVYGSVQGESAWEVGQNAGQALDHWLGLSAGSERYVTLTVIPATALMLLGTLAGELLRSSLSPVRKTLFLVGAGAVGVLLGWLLSGGGGPLGISWPALIPLVRRLGSASFVLLAVGWALLLLAPLYLLLDGTGWRRVGLPLTLVGMNSLAFFVALALFRDWARRSTLLVLPASEGFAPYRAGVAEAGVVVLFWLLALWLYRRRIFLKV